MNRFMFHMAFISFLHIQPHIRILNNTTWWLIGNISRYSINLNERDLSSNTYSTLVMNQMLVRFYWKRRSLFLYHFKTDYFFLTRFSCVIILCNLWSMKIMRWDYKLVVCRVNITTKDTQSKPSLSDYINNCFDCFGWLNITKSNLLIIKS